jgi:hypothetical protein
MVRAGCAPESSAPAARDESYGDDVILPAAPELATQFVAKLWPASPQADCSFVARPSQNSEPQVAAALT